MNNAAVLSPIDREDAATRRRKMGVALALFFMTRPFQDLLVVGGVDIQLLLIGLIVLLLATTMVGEIPRFLWFLTRDKLLLLLLALVPLSLLWSVAPTRSLLGLANFGAGTVVGVYLAMRFSLRQQLQIVAWALALAAVVSLAVGLVSPPLGRMFLADGSLAWKGVYEHKNSLGRYMAILGAAAWALTLERKRWGRWGFFFLLALLLIVLASSATPLLALTVMVGVLPLLGIFRWRDAGIRLISLLLLLLAVWTLLILLLHPALNQFADYGLALLGRDPDRNTLLIRFGLWEYAWGYIAQRPILGYGFDAFWSLPGRRELITYVGRVWEVQQAHNGFIELWLQLGLVGLTGMICHLFVNVHRILRAAPLLSVAEFTWAAGYVVVLAVLNTSYSALLGQLTVPWSLYVAITLSICVQLTRHPETEVSLLPGAGA